MVGGSAAGPKAAARAHRLDQEAEITIVQALRRPKAVALHATGVIRDPACFMEAKGIRALTGTVAESRGPKEPCGTLPERKWPWLSAAA